MFARLFGGGATETTSDGASSKEKEGDRSNGSETPQQQEKDDLVASHISKMDSIIRRKLHGTGAQYNMKVVIRGERGVGKSTLWRRLQGLPFEEKYLPTPEIQTTTVNNWVYRGSQDVVKVEVWDVVDKGLARGAVGRVPDGEDLEDAMAGLPPVGGSGRGGRSLAVLDAGVVNVYQGASAVVFMVDPYRPETLDKVEKGLVEAPVNLPTVVLLNFRDKMEEDAVAKASSGKQGIPAAAATAATAPRESGQTPSVATSDAGAAQTVSGDPPPNADGGGKASAAADASKTKSEGVVSAAVAAEGVVLVDGGGGGGGGDGVGGAGIERDDKEGAWDHVVTLETARQMMDRVREADIAAGKGNGRRVSLFDCSMKNCFGLRVLYTYLNVPFLELKRQSLLQQAQIASERLEKEYQELAGFIGGHSYGNYMQHLRTSDVDPTAGRSVPAAPPGRPSIASNPPLEGEPSLERHGSVDSHGGRKDKKKKHHKDKDKDKSKKKDKHHRHKSGKSRKDGREEAPPEYGGRVTDAKDFAPVTKKSATDELADFFGESSEADSDDGLHERRKVVKNINKSALASANAAKDEATDSDEMPVPRTSRLKRVSAPAKPVASAAATVEKKTSSTAIEPPKPPSRNPRAEGPAGAGGDAPVISDQRSPRRDVGASSAASGVGDEKDRKEEQPLRARGKEEEEEEVQEDKERRSTGEGEKREGKEARAGAGAGEGTALAKKGNAEAERVGSSGADGDSDGNGDGSGDDGEKLPGVGARAAAASSDPPASSQSEQGEETTVRARDEAGEEKAGREGAECSRPASQQCREGEEQGAGDDSASDRRRQQPSEFQERAADVASDHEERGVAAETETAEEQEIESGTAPSSVALEQPSPAPQQDLPPKRDAPRLSQEVAPKERRVDTGADEMSDDGVALGVDGTADTDTEGRHHTDRTPTPQEGGVSPESGAGPLSALTTGAEEEGVIHASLHVGDEESPKAYSVGGEAATVDKQVPAVVGSEPAEDADPVPVPSSAVTAESDGLGAEAGEEQGSGGGGGSDSGESGDGDGALNRAADGDINSSEAAVGGATGGGGGGGGVGDKSGPAAAREPERIDEDGIAGGGALNGHVVAEDFFAGDDSSGEDELYPGAAAAAGTRIAPAEGASGNSNRDQERPARDKPPSPRIIASSVQAGSRAGIGGGFGYPSRSPVSTQRKVSAAVGEGGLSEAAKAAVAAALANASSAPSRREGDGSKSRKKKKSSNKERRRKRSGSKSGGEEDSGAGDRDGGSVGRSEEDGTGRAKRSSSRRQHRKPTV